MTSQDTTLPLSKASIDSIVLQHMGALSLPEGNPVQKLNAYRALVLGGAAAVIAAQAQQAQGVPRLNYVPLHEFAQLHGVDYNKLCKAVLESVLAVAPQPEREPLTRAGTLTVGEYPMFIGTKGGDKP